MITCLLRVCVLCDRSIGCILYELVALTHAFEGQSLMGVMYKIVEGDLPKWPSEFTKDLGNVFAKLAIS